MKKNTRRLKSAILGIALLSSAGTLAQNIEVSAGYGNYTPAVFPGYGTGEGARGIFEASAGKTSGVIPPYTAIVTVMLAPEIPWTEEAFPMPDGWEQLDTGDPMALAFTNSAPWTTEDPYFIIPVRAIAARSTTDRLVGTQIMNDGGDWTDPDPLNNNVRSAVQVNDVPLPVVLSQFSAAKEGISCVLSWSTTEESNSERFEVHHSPDGKNWSTIGSVVAKGESSTLSDYRLVHENLLRGLNYYRLKMIDRDASFAYSGIAVVDRSDAIELSLYPNPSNGSFRIKSDVSVANYRIIKNSGTVVSEWGIPNSTDYSISVSHLPSGVYLVEIELVNKERITRQLVLN